MKDKKTGGDLLQKIKKNGLSLQRSPIRKEISKVYLLLFYHKKEKSSKKIGGV
jgi:hypothetical protein